MLAGRVLAGHVAGHPEWAARAVVDWETRSITATVDLAGERWHIHPAHMYREFPEAGPSAAGSGALPPPHVAFRARDVPFPVGVATCGEAHTRLKQSPLLRNATRFPAPPAGVPPAGAARTTRRGACTKCTCPLALVADATAFAGPHCQKSVSTCAAYMVATLQAVNDMYLLAVLGGNQGYGFSIKKIIVYTVRAR